MVDSGKLEDGCGMIHAGFCLPVLLGSEDDPVPMFWNLLHCLHAASWVA